jgi:hypothetical protein
LRKIRRWEERGAEVEVKREKEKDINLKRTVQRKERSYGSV